MEAKDKKNSGSFEKEDSGKFSEDILYSSDLVGGPLNYFDSSAVAGWLGDDDDEDLDDQGDDDPAQRSFRGIVFHH